MWDHPAAFHARRLRVLYALSERATVPQLLAVCKARGVPVLRGNLRTPGLFVNSPRTGPMILLAHRASARVLAHELFHAILCDADDHGVVYRYFGEGGDVEDAANDFAVLLTGTAQERKRLGV